MLTALMIYDRSNQGLDIILDLVPQAIVGVENHKKKFKYRMSEGDPSANLLPPDDRHPYWRLIDYGLRHQKPISPIDLYMEENNMGQHQFKQALYDLAARYGVVEDKICKNTGGEWIERPAQEGEIEEQRVFKTRDTFTEAEIKFWGSNVTEEILREYGWKPVEYIGTVKKGQIKELHSTLNYPIFAQECNYTDKEGNIHTFHKIYKPREYNKKFRFEYVGTGPTDYIFGLEALKRAWHKNGEEKLEQVFIVSGGSDGATCRAMGGQPVWLNSETKDFTHEQEATLLKYAKRIIYIGDVDATGKECARLLALKYLDIYTIWLPEKVLSRYRDSRGNKRKDLKDYMQIFPNKKEFWKLVGQAKLGRFWNETVKTDSTGKPTIKYSLSPTALCYFLELNGYYTIHDDNYDKPQYIQIDGFKVKKVTPKNIRNFMNEWSAEYPLPKTIQDMLRRSKDLPNKETSNLRELDLNFTTGTSTSQLHFFNNVWVEVTAEGIEKYRYNEKRPENVYVWHKSVIAHNYVEHKDMFTAVECEDGSIIVKLTDDAQSNLAIFLRNTSRLHWRQVDEQGIPLTPEQQHEEDLCLTAKIVCIGYYLHHFRDASLALAAILLDQYLAEDEREANGRTGKSLLLAFLQAMNNYFHIDAHNPDCVTERFLFDGVTRWTTLIGLEECARLLAYDFFFGKVSGKFRFEEKGNHPITIDEDEVPKLIFISNYVLKDMDSSKYARLWPQIFSDYYHKMVPGKNDYHEDRSVRDTFGYNLFDAEYPEKQWEADIAFAMQCLKFYLSLPHSKRKIMPPMGSIEKRVQSANIGPNVMDWATKYYADGSEHLDVTEDYDTVLKDYKTYSGDWNMSEKVFTRRLKEFCSFAEHILCYNPAELTEGKKEGSRIRVRMPNNSNKKINKIHVRSTQWNDTQAKQSIASEQKPQQLDLFNNTPEDVPF